MIFYPIKYYQNQNLQIQLLRQNNNMHDFKNQFLLIDHYSPILKKNT